MWQSASASAAIAVENAFELTSESGSPPGQCEVADDAVGQVGHRRQVGLAERAQHPHAGRLTRVQRIDEPRRQLGAHPGGAACEPVHQPQQRGPDDVGGRVRPLAHPVAGEQELVEVLELAGVHRHARVRADAGGEAVDGRVRPHRLVHDLPACGHPLDRLGRKLDPAAAAGHVADTASGQVEAGEKEGFAHATRHRSSASRSGAAPSPGPAGGVSVPPATSTGKGRGKSRRSGVQPGGS